MPFPDGFKIESNLSEGELADVVLIAGTDCIAEIAMAKAKLAENPSLKYIIVGNGAEDRNGIIRPEEISALKGRIKPTARVDIVGHGGVAGSLTSKDQHVIGVLSHHEDSLTPVQILKLGFGRTVSEFSTEHLLNLVNGSLPNDTYSNQVHLWSCFGGKGANYIPGDKKAIWMFHSPENTSTLVSCCVSGIGAGIAHHAKDTNPITACAQELIQSPESATIAFNNSGTNGKCTHTFHQTEHIGRRHTNEDFIKERLEGCRQFFLQNAPGFTPDKINKIQSMTPEKEEIERYIIKLVALSSYRKGKLPQNSQQDISHTLNPLSRSLMDRLLNDASNPLADLVTTGGTSLLLSSLNQVNDPIDSRQNTILHVLSNSQEPDLDAVQKILDLGSDILQENSQGISPLETAISFHNLELVKKFFECNKDLPRCLVLTEAQKNDKTNPQFIKDLSKDFTLYDTHIDMLRAEMPKANGDHKKIATLINMIPSSKQADAVRYLRDCTDIPHDPVIIALSLLVLKSEKENNINTNLLGIIAPDRSVENVVDVTPAYSNLAVEVLEQVGDQLNLNACDGNKSTILHKCAWFGTPTLASSLLRYGSDPASVALGSTPLDLLNRELKEVGLSTERGTIISTMILTLEAAEAKKRRASPLSAAAAAASFAEEQASRTQLSLLESAPTSSRPTGADAAIPAPEVDAQSDLLLRLREARDSRNAQENQNPQQTGTAASTTSGVGTHTDRLHRAAGGKLPTNFRQTDADAAAPAPTTSGVGTHTNRLHRAAGGKLPTNFRQTGADAAAPAPTNSDEDTHANRILRDESNQNPIER